jgi:DNA-binding NtrC family response regulator
MQPEEKRKGRNIPMHTMLIVEDDPKVRGLLYDLFKDWNVCHVAWTAEQAVSYLANQTYDVVLTDISMPGLSGLELLGHVREHYPEVPVIIISGIDDQEYAQGLAKLNAFDYLVKPFHLAAVEASVERALARRQRLLEEHQGHTGSAGTEQVG